MRGLFGSFVIYTGSELGVSDETKYLSEKLGRLVTFCSQLEFLAGFSDFTPDWDVEVYTQLLDIDTFFEYFQPKYDLAVISTDDYNAATRFLTHISRAGTPYIVSTLNMGSRGGYVLRVFGERSDKVYLYYQNPISNWN